MADITKDQNVKKDQKEKSLKVFNRSQRAFIVAGKRTIKANSEVVLPESIARKLAKDYPADIKLMVSGGE